MALFKCPECGREISDRAASCPHCGCPIETETKQPANLSNGFTKNKTSEKNYVPSPKIKKRTLIAIIAIIAFILFAIILLNPSLSSSSRLNWDEIVLGDILPEPQSSKCEVSSNTKDYLLIHFYNVSSEEYTSYVDACSNAGFTIDTQEETSTYVAFNNDGYRLSIYYWEYDKEMQLCVESPIEMTSIQWPDSEIASLIPIPDSKNGRIDRDDAQGFDAYIGNMSPSKFNSYVSKCKERGFTFDVESQERYYSAQNETGYQLSVTYRGYDIIHISILEPQFTVELKLTYADPSSVKNYDVDIYVDDTWEGTLEVDDKVETYELELNMGAHELKIENEDDDDVYTHIEFNVTKDELFQYEIRCEETDIWIVNPNNASSPQSESSSESEEESTSPDTEENTLIDGNCFTYTAHSFMKRFDKSDEDADGYNYVYMRRDGDPLYYELVDTENNYKTIGMVAFDKSDGSSLSVNEDFTNNIINTITILVENIDDVPAVLVGCMCGADPSLDFTSAYNIGEKVVEKAGTENGYTHNNIKYVIVTDDEYYFIIIEALPT